ncbi:helix-turn-helix transcriptional regulator [Pedobacter psychroterrae]|uniref:LuxR family transcriptional regulator n=1 Tax=Pedobacter psychroterrae TaxID=2530453 RepID=A0A4R0NSP4_9SPHI|nr:helix-turn-helix transcriptional regulator [Pedobacter psychroterrae]TCD03159.1 LuxR family transcriptional regulator [Pedobacter psychroterrae]
MLVFGSQLHLLTFIIVLLELMTLPFVWWYYYSWPGDKSRLWYFILLALLVFYNLTGGMFPDPKLRFISVTMQNIIAYGSGFGMAAYFPYYFYKSFGLERLRKHLHCWVPLCLLLPFVLFFCVLYPLTKNLDLAINLGMLLPLVYSPILLRAILLSIRERFRSNELSLYPYGKAEMWAVYLAVSPWVLMCVFSYLRVSQWVEVLATNIGFIIITVLFMLRSGRMERLDKQRMLELESSGDNQHADCLKLCAKYNLSKREVEVARLHCQGLTYEQIGEKLFISKRTVDTYVQRIYFKTGVNTKITLQKKLGFGLINSSP